jgi:acetolactate synthase I/II/III large subunit
MMHPITKYTRQISSGANIPARVREAFRRAEDERPGAVNLELPEDIAREETEAPVIPRSRFEAPRASVGSIAAAVEMIEAARHPLLLVGAGANRRQTCRALPAFVERTGIPFFSTQMGKGVVDERHPRFLGNAALSGDDFPHRAAEAADLIINVGHDVVEKPPFIMGRPENAPPHVEEAARAGEARVIHVNYVTASVDAVYHPHQGVIGDIADSVERLTAAVRPQAHWDFTRFLEVKSHLDEHLREGAEDDRFPMSPQRLVADIRAALPDDAYGMKRWEKAAMGFEDYGLIYGNPDFVRYTEAYGAQGHKVESAGALGSLLASCLAAPGVHVIDVPVDYSDNERILNREIKARSRAI